MKHLLVLALACALFGADQPMVRTSAAQREPALKALNAVMAQGRSIAELQTQYLQLMAQRQEEAKKLENTYQESIITLKDFCAAGKLQFDEKSLDCVPAAEAKK